MAGDTEETHITWVIPCILIYYMIGLTYLATENRRNISHDLATEIHHCHLIIFLQREGNDCTHTGCTNHVWSSLAYYLPQTNKYKHTKDLTYCNVAWWLHLVLAAETQASTRESTREGF